MKERENGHTSARSAAHWPHLRLLASEKCWVCLSHPTVSVRACIWERERRTHLRRLKAQEANGVDASVRTSDKSCCFGCPSGTNIVAVKHRADGALSQFCSMSIAGLQGCFVGSRSRIDCPHAATSRRGCCLSRALTRGNEIEGQWYAWEWISMCSLFLSLRSDQWTGVAWRWFVFSNPSVFAARRGIRLWFDDGESMR